MGSLIRSFSFRVAFGICTSTEKKIIQEKLKRERESIGKRESGRERP